MGRYGAYWLSPSLDEYFFNRYCEEFGEKLTAENRKKARYYARTGQRRLIMLLDSFGIDIKLFYSDNFKGYLVTNEVKLFFDKILSFYGSGYFPDIKDKFFLYIPKYELWDVGIKYMAALKSVRWNDAGITALRKKYGRNTGLFLEESDLPYSELAFKVSGYWRQRIKCDLTLNEWFLYLKKLDAVCKKEWMEMFANFKAQTLEILREHCKDLGKEIDTPDSILNAFYFYKSTYDSLFDEAYLFTEDSASQHNEPI